ncbi:Gamma-aminobutyric acid (GABA) B receptor (Partial), partial [Seminavis robusta]|eukprot:Sro620_g176560.1 Gamma-aminobutyric acid (GABA) B receptor (1627) ;mRNA; r:2-5677
MSTTTATTKATATSSSSRRTSSHSTTASTTTTSSVREETDDSIPIYTHGDDAASERRTTSTTSSTTSTTTANTDSLTKQTTFVIIDKQEQEEDELLNNSEANPYWTSAAPLVSISTMRSVVNLVATEATLLSGNLDDCYEVDDDSCQAGVAAVGAFVRHWAKDQPTLVFPKFEKQSQFVQVHPLGWSVNRLILQGMLGWKLLMSTPSLLLQNQRDEFGSQRDLSYLQSRQFPLLLTNVVVPPSNSWALDYHEYIHFDHDTGMALLSIANSGEPLNHNQVASAWGALYTIADRNRELGCLTVTEDARQALFESYQDVYMNGDTSSSSSNSNDPQCWIPVVVFDDGQTGKFAAFIEGVMKHPHPPYLIIDVDKNAVDLYPTPMLVHVPIGNNHNSTRTEGGITNTTTTTIIRQPSKPVWIHSFGRKDDIYYQHQLVLDWTTLPPILLNVTLIQEDMEVVPPEYKDDTYANHIRFLRQQADSAIQNDPQVGYSTAFPVAREGEYRRCQGGECEVGNLFTDALRWKAHADVAFVTSGGLRGSGWPAGPVRVSNIWASLPFPNSICTGIMSGLSLFRMMDYSISISTFEGYDTNDGDRLLQISGMNIVYNTDIPRGTTRILSIDVWNRDVKEWLPIDRLGMYKFATDSYLCSAYDPYPDFLGANGNYTMEGEVPGTIGDALVQNAVGEFLGQLDGPYDGAIQGRLANNTESFEVLDLGQTKENCPVNNYWSERRGACFACPDSSYVEFSDASLEFEGQQSGDGGIIPSEDSKASSVYNATSNSTDPSIFEDVLRGRILLVNRELFNFSVVPKAIPSWLKFIEEGELSERYVVGGPTTALPSGSSLALDFVVGDKSIRSGTALGTVSFGILGRSVQGEEGIRSCDDYSRDATFDVFLKVTPPQELNELGGLRYIGIGMMIVTLLSAAFFGYCLFKYRETAILKTMQPIFLVTICCGVFTMAFTILPLSLDDMILSDKGADAACMATPWLLSMGLVVIFSALYSKLWRINQLFNVASFRRMKVTERDVLLPFAVLFSLNTALLIAWNIVDPLRSERLAVEGEEWKSYAACRSDGVGYVLMYTIGAVNVAALLMACYQAYQARNISVEFAESRSVGLAVGCWLQVLLVGFPALYLVDPDDIVASYFLQVGLIVVLAMSMMLIIFGPLVMMVFQYKRNPGSLNGGRARGSVFITGTSSHHETGSFYSGYNGSGRTGGSLRRSQPFAGMRNSKRHSFAGQDDKTLKEMVAIVASKELGISGSGNGSGNASASSLGDSFNASKPFEVPVHPVERFQDEESSNANLETDFSRKRVSDIIEESESVCSASIASSRHVLASRPLLEDLADSITSIKCPEQDVTPQMLLLDLVPRSTAQKMLDESESTVPFCGGDFLSDNLLGNDSDSSVPFQGSNHFLDDGSAVSGEPMDGSSRRSRGKGRVSDSEVPPLTKEEIPSNETSATDLSRSASSYSQHLLQSSCSERTQSQRGHVTVAVSYHNSDSSSKQEDVFERDAGKPVATKPVIATIENRTSKKEKEIPFSSRFVDYKNRLSSLRSEDGTLSTIDSPTRESRPADSITKMNDSLVQVQDESNGSGVDRRGSFQMMNDYIVESLRDVSDHESSAPDRLDHSGTRRQNDRKS